MRRDSVSVGAERMVVTVDAHLLGVAGGITDGIYYPGEDPRTAQGSGCNGVLQPRDEGASEDDREHLQGVLVSPCIVAIMVSQAQESGLSWYLRWVQLNVKAALLTAASALSAYTVLGISNERRQSKVDATDLAGSRPWRPCEHG